MTIEDPVERVVDGTVQVEVNPRAGLTFARGLRTILRSDPDVILVGEIRDAETAQIAMEAAMTGHLVLTTLHAESAPAALVRLRELGIPAATIASSLRLVLSQRLLRKVCDVCRGQSEGSWRGCPDCGFSGYRGRIAAYESLELDDGVRAIVGASSDDLAMLASRRIATTIRQRAEQLAASGITTDAEVVRVCGETRASSRTLVPAEAVGGDEVVRHALAREHLLDPLGHRRRPGDEVAVRGEIRAELVAEQRRRRCGGSRPPSRRRRSS